MWRDSPDLCRRIYQRVSIALSVVGLVRLRAIYQVNFTQRTAASVRFNGAGQWLYWYSLMTLIRLTVGVNVAVMALLFCLINFPLCLVAISRGII